VEYEENLSEEQKAKLLYLRTPLRVPGQHHMLW
jgi:hypothetical protein